MLSYDDASPETQAEVRREWDRRITQARTRLDLTAEFCTQGRSWSECDADGKVVVRR